MATPDTPLEITVWPARNRARFWRFVFFILAIPILFGWVFGPYWGVFAWLVLMGSTFSFYVPTTYRFTDTGIEIRRGPIRYERPWSQFKRVERDAHGIFLGTFKFRSRLDPFRGLYLLVQDPETQERVLAVIQEKTGLYDASRESSEDTGND